jgi:hypothetical protein
MFLSLFYDLYFFIFVFNFSDGGEGNQSYKQQTEYNDQLQANKQTAMRGGNISYKMASNNNSRRHRPDFRCMQYVHHCTHTHTHRGKKVLNFSDRELKTIKRDRNNSSYIASFNVSFFKKFFL